MPVRLNRRSLLGAAVAGAGSLAMPWPRASAADSPLSPLETFIRIRSGLANQRAYWWYSGYLLGRVEGSPAVPLLTIQGASYGEIRLTDSGGYQHDLVEAGYYGDLDSGQVVDRWMNPLNGKMVDAIHYYSQQSLLFNEDLTVTPSLKAIPAGLEFTGRITGPDVKHGRVWMAEELFVKLPARNGSAATANSLANFEAGIDDVVNDQLAFVPASFEYTTLNSFRPWMQMGDTLGTISMRLNGVKLPGPEQIDVELMQRILEDHPDFLTRLVPTQKGSG